jgi:hypothetical protein
VTEDELAIRQVVENWAVWRDAGDWERFATVWHDDAIMVATWYQGAAAGFIAASRRGFEDGIRVLHFLGGMSVDVRSPRAIAQTKMTISQRVTVDGVLCDVVCTGRFYDFFEQRNGRWAVVLRQPIYEMDRLACVDPAQSLQIDDRLLERFPEGYRYLGYAQTKSGLTVKTDLPGLAGPEVDALYARGRAWLAGQSAV